MPGPSHDPLKACQRCGVLKPSRAERPAPICMDCRQADPVYVKCVKAGVRAA